MAYQYIEGWQPQAYNLGKTLTADASENQFTFVYTPVPTVTNVNTVVVPGPQVPAPEQGQEPEEEPAPPVTVVTPPEEEEEPEPGVVEVEDEVPPLAEPEDYEDLDEEETPLGGFGDNEDDGSGGTDGKNVAESILEDLATPLAMRPTPAKAGILAAVVALAGAGICWLVMTARRKGKKENEQ